MEKQNSIKLFESKKVRAHWDEVQEKWYFSVIDVIEILTGSSIPKRYWSDLKKKLKSEGSEKWIRQRMIYKMYELSDKEVKVVNQFFWLSAEEYVDFKTEIKWKIITKQQKRLNP
jgi:hypothetical protein